MNAQAHIDKAEALLISAEQDTDDGVPVVAVSRLLQGILHAMIGLAIEAGVPHPTQTQEVTGA